MPLGDLPHQGETEADAAGLLGMAGQAVERLEDALAERLGNARAAVADGQPRAGAIAIVRQRRGDGDLAAAA